MSTLILRRQQQFEKDQECQGKTFYWNHLTQTSF